MKKRLPRWLIEILVRLKLARKIIIYKPNNRVSFEMDADSVLLWKDYLIGKYAGKTVGDVIGEHFLEIKRHENFPNCWIIYRKKSWEDIYD